MSIAIGGVGSSSITNLIAQLESFSPEALEAMGLTASALECMIKILEKVESMLSDGIQPDEVSGLKDLTQTLDSVTNVELQVVADLKLNLEEMDKILETMELLAPGLIDKLKENTAQSKGTSGAPNLSNVASLRKSFETTLIEELESVGDEQDATDDHTDQSLEIMMQRLNTNLRAESHDLNKNRDISLLNQSLKSKFNMYKVAPSSGLSRGSTQSNSFARVSTQGLSGKLQAGGLQDLSASNSKVDQQQLKKDRMLIENVKQHEQEIRETIKKMDDTKDDVIKNATDGILSLLQGYVEQAIMNSCGDVYDDVIDKIDGLNLS